MVYGSIGSSENGYGDWKLYGIILTAMIGMSIGIGIDNVSYLSWLPSTVAVLVVVIPLSFTVS